MDKAEEDISDVTAAVTSLELPENSKSEFLLLKEEI